jgi:hypothetical protein
MSPDGVATRGTATHEEDTMEETPGPSQGTSAAEWRSTDGGLRLTYTQPQLNKKNYVNWISKTQILLEIQGIWDIVSGDE